MSLVAKLRKQTACIIILPFCIIDDTAHVDIFSTSPSSQRTSVLTSHTPTCELSPISNTPTVLMQFYSFTGIGVDAGRPPKYKQPKFTSDCSKPTVTESLRHSH